MDKVKALLLPLALVFGAIAVFETGARYGSTNMRAYAIANELQLRVGTYVNLRSIMNENYQEQHALAIDTNLAAGAMHRQVWFLNKKAKAMLDKTLGYALAVRGEAAIQRFENPDDVTRRLMGAEPEKVLNSLKLAKYELLDNAPSLAEKEAQEAGAEASE